MIAKRDFLTAITCARWGWYDVHGERSSPSVGDQWMFYVGNRVGDLARTWLGNGALLPISPVEAAREATATALEDAEAALVFEATFVAGGFVARADALRRCDDGWELIEIKSGKMPDAGKAVSSNYIDDVAYTCAVVQAAGVLVSRVALVLLDRTYTLGAAEQFGTVDVTDDVRKRSVEFALMMPDVAAALQSELPPPPLLQAACKNCDHFATQCIGVGVDDSILRIPRLSGARFEAVRPFARIRALPRDVDLTSIQQRVVDVIRENVPYRDTGALRELSSVVWPALYLDFETAMPALPWFAGDTPYASLVTQYSIHECASPGSVSKHCEYLAPHTHDWRRELVEQLLADLGTSGSVIVYSSYEQTQLTAFAKSFPDLDGRINAVISRLFDLEKIFSKAFVHPGYAGASSIKKVLPVLVPGLTYDTMDVGNGADASALFSLMQVGEIDASLHAQHRRALLEYCKLDTMAMVELHAAVLRV